jgi:hypothetical protein
MRICDIIDEYHVNGAFDLLKNDHKTIILIVFIIFIDHFYLGFF